MKFIIEYKNTIQQRLLTYIPEECSFYMGEITSKVDVELILNKISLVVSENKIVHVSGFCGLDTSMKTKYKVPEYKKGILKVKYDLKYGFAYGINDEEWPVYINIHTGWVCIGDPHKTGQAVEFISNCVAVLEEKQLVALWLKPISLPYELKAVERTKGFGASFYDTGKTLLVDFPKPVARLYRVTTIRSLALCTKAFK